MRPANQTDSWRRQGGDGEGGGGGRGIYSRGGAVDDVDVALWPCQCTCIYIHM